MVAPGRHIGQGRAVTFHHPHRLRHVHPVRPHGHRQRHGRRLPEQIQRPRIRRHLPQHPVARREQQPDQQRKGLLGAGGDQDLPGPVGTPRAAYRAATAARSAPIPAGLERSPSGSTSERYASASSAGGRSGAAQLSRITSSGASRRCRKSGFDVSFTRGVSSVSAAAATRVPLPWRRTSAPSPPERLVRGDHRRTAHGEGRREPPVRRQERGRGQRTLVDQPAQPGGEQQVQRPAPGGPAAEPGDEVVRAGQGPGRAGQGPGRGGQGPGGGGQGSGRGGERRVDWLHRRTNLPGLDL
ncbi:hypothetical protein STANM309S_06586 [Streptomyces tanashiensis]